MNDPLGALTAALAGLYAVEEELGVGGMATVYLAEDLKHHRKVAVKVLRPELAAVLGAERFLKEIEVTANLQHPHILPLHDSGEAGGGKLGRGMPRPFLYYVMPYVEGETLRDKLNREKQLAVEEAIEITRAVGSALDYAHRHGVVHRDIKPENILLHDGQPVVADFGIALAVSAAGGNRITETGMSLGTPHYMSPEQAMGDRELDARSDVYSLACVTYEMLVGEPPYTGPTAQAIVAKVITEKPQHVTVHRDTVPAHVDAAVYKALEKLPADRFATAAQFAEALANPAYTLPATGVASSVAAPGGRPWQRKSFANWQIAVLVVAAVAVGLFFGNGRADTAAVSRGPVDRFALGAVLGDVGRGSKLLLSPDASRLVYVGVGEEGGSRLFRRRLAEVDALPIPGTEGSLVQTPFFSPDGDMLGFYAEQQLRTVEVDGGSPRAIAPVSPVASGATWAPGDLLVYNSDVGGGLMVVAAEGGEPRTLTTVDTAAGEFDHRWPHALPDGRAVAFTIWRGTLATARLAVASIETGEVRELLPGTNPHYVEPGYLVYASAEGALRAVAFDMDRGKVRGSPVTVLAPVSVTANGSASIAVSLNGTLALVSAETSMVPVLADSNGSVTPLPRLEPGSYQSPRFSPDGTSFAVVSINEQVEDVWVYDFALGTFSPLTLNSGFYPLWTPDGEHILFSRDEGPDVSVYSARADRGAEEVAVLRVPGQQHRTQDLSLDGRHLLLRRNVGAEGYDLYSLALDSGGTPEPWLATESLERAPTFSPDGKWVAYSSDESGRYEVYVRPFPGPGGRIPVSTRGGSEPAWAPDGTRLYYRNGNRFQVVEVQTEPTFRVLTPPRTIFEGRYYAYSWQRQYDVHPDGDHFLLFQYQSEASEVTVVVNFIEELKAQVSR